MITFCSLFSGSTGNSSYLSTDQGAILIDSGLSAKQILQGIEHAKLSSKNIQAILVTHEHSDHIRSVGILSRKLNIPVMASEGTWDGMNRTVGEIANSNRVIIRANERFFQSGMEVLPFAIPHDANEPLAFRFDIGNRGITIATDIGHYTNKMHNIIQGSEIVLLESNHDPELLNANTKYPAYLKKRILGRKGHLCNEDCANASVKLVQSGTKHLLLGHLSAQNNHPELAHATTADTLESMGIVVNQDVSLHVASPVTCTHVYRLK